MRVLMTTDTIGGVWSFTRELAAGLLAEGCAMALVGLGRQAAPAQAEWASALEARCPGRFRFFDTGLPLEWMQGNDRAFEDAASLLLRLADDFGADVIHANQFCFGALPTRLPKLVTAHSDVLSWAKACAGSRLEDSAWLRHYVELVEAGLAAADVVVAPTRWMLDALAENFDIRGARALIPNGISLARAAGGARKLQAVTAGRLWDPAKNVALLAEVVSPMPLLVAGETTCEAAVAPAVGGATLLGALAEEDLLALFRESAIYICTSVYEPFGLAPLEAAGRGCAVLANDIASLREVWGEGALYFDGAASLSRLLARLYSDADALSAAQARSFERAQRYGREAMTAGYLALFERLAESPREIARVA